MWKTHSPARKRLDFDIHSSAGKRSRCPKSSITIWSSSFLPRGQLYTLDLGGISNDASNRSGFYGRPPPPHVPPELLRRIDIFNDPVMASDPFALIRRLREEPPMIYNMHNPLKGQSWIPTRARNMREVLGNTDKFSNINQTGFAELIGEHWRMGPLEMDNPDHGKFRRLMNPWFSPPAVKKISTIVRERARELIEALAGQSGCDFVSAFAIPFPISIFMELMGLPRSEMTIFLEWVDKLLHNDDPIVQAEGAASIVQYLRSLIRERRAVPRDDIATKIATGTIDGQLLSDDDVLGSCFLLFTGGLDTVTSSLSFYFQHLASNIDFQERLRKNPGDIPQAIEEYLRAFSPVHGSRCAKIDMSLGGVEVKKGDWITILYGLGSLDPTEFSKPDEVDFDRRDNRHFAFAYGTHFCMGAHLARRELHVALEEWLKTMPPFRLADRDHPVETHGGVVFGVKRLELQW